jgi:hypothetical protein
MENDDKDWWIYQDADKAWIEKQEKLVVAFSMATAEVCEITPVAHALAPETLRR